MIAGPEQSPLRRAATRAATALRHAVSGFWAPIQEALHRPGARIRWAIVAVVVLVLCSLPALVSALPVSTPEKSVPELMSLVRSSSSVPFTGFAESRGTLDLPDINTVGSDVVGLLSARSQLRVWNAGTNRFRVDRLSNGGETDTYVFGSISVNWDSGPRRLQRQVSAATLPEPGPPDVLPTALGRRMLETLPADGSGVRLGDRRRIAGRATVAMIWHPNDPRSLIGQVKVWVDPTNGLPLRVELTPTGTSVDAFDTSFLDLSLTPPDPHSLSFDVAGTERIDVQDAVPQSPDNTRPQVPLPRILDGLPQRSEAHPFVSTFGTGPVLVAVVGFDGSTADSIRQQIDSPGRPPLHGAFGEGTLVEAPMLRALIFSSAGRGYVLAGPVTPEVLQAMALDLVRASAAAPA